MKPSLQIAVACLLLPACHRHPAAKDDLFEAVKVEDGQTALALKAVSHLRDAFNAGDCQTIYTGAGTYFRFQNSADWAYECQDLQSRLGRWRNFQFKFSEVCGKAGTIVCIVGLAEFEKQTTDIAVTWEMNGKDARLFSLALKEDGETWINIPAPHFRDRHVDPPEPKSPANGVVL